MKYYYCLIIALLLHVEHTLFSNSFKRVKKNPLQKQKRIKKKDNDIFGSCEY